MTDNATVTQGNGVVSSAAQFNGSTEYLSIADNADLSTGDIDFSIATWVKLDTKTETKGIITKWSGSWEYSLWYKFSNDRFEWNVKNNGGIVYANNFGSPPTGQWIFIVAWHDSINNTLNIQVNNGPVDSISYTGGLVDTTDTFRIGTGNVGLFLDGLIDEVRMYKKVLSGAERNQLYLSGRAKDKGVSSTTGLANNNDGQLHGPTWRRASQCKIGKCLEFDGTDDYVSVGNVFNGVKSVAFWLYPDDNTSRKIIDLNGTAQIELDASGNLTATNFTSPTVYINGLSASAATTQGAWQHVVVTTGTGINASAVDLGRVATGYFDGKLDDVRMFDYVLSQKQIMQLYNRGKPVAHYKFDEGVGTTAYDESNYNNDGTLTNFPTYGTNWVTGKFGKALLFDGTNDFVTTANSNSIDIQGDLTIGAWVKAADFATTTDSYIVHKDSGTAGYAFGFGITTPNKLALKIDGTVYESSTTYSLTNNTWHHFEVSLTGTTATFYVDGKQLGTTVTATNAPPASSSAQALRVGSDGTSYFTGTLDDVRVYNYARSASEVLIDYNGGLAAGFGN